MKIKKLEIDLSLDLTEYIPAPEGLIDSDKKSPGHLFEWARFVAREGDRLGERQRAGMTNEQMIDETMSSLISQIDWFYGKGPDFWRLLPISILRDIVTHLSGQVTPAQKK